MKGAAQDRQAGVADATTVAVCIVGFRNPDDIARCVAAVGQSAHRKLRIVICENGGAAACAALRERLELNEAAVAMQIVEAAGNIGYAGGVNVCIARAPEVDAWWILNPDTEAAPDALSLMLARLAKGDVQAVGCSVCTPEGTIESCGGRWRPSMARAVSLAHGVSTEATLDDAALERQVSYLSGASMLVARAFVEIAGPLREDYFLYGEEVEWCLRADARGARLGLVSAARVVHYQGSTTGSVADIRHRSRTAVYLDERNKLLLTRDLFPGRLPIVAVAMLPLIFLRFARRGAWRQVGYAIGGWWAGLRGHRGPPSWI